MTSTLLRLHGVHIANGTTVDDDSADRQSFSTADRPSFCSPTVITVLHYSADRGDPRKSVKTFCLIYMRRRVVARPVNNPADGDSGQQRMREYSWSSSTRESSRN